MINRYFELVAFAVNGEVAEEVFYLTDTVNMLQVLLALHHFYSMGGVDSYKISFFRECGSSSPLSAREMC